jgi:hypothetical protein
MDNLCEMLYTSLHTSWTQLAKELSQKKKQIKFVEINVTFVLYSKNFFSKYLRFSR